MSFLIESIRPISTVAGKLFAARPCTPQDATLPARSSDGNAGRTLFETNPTAEGGVSCRSVVRGCVSRRETHEYVVIFSLSCGSIFHRQGTDAVRELIRCTALARIVHGEGAWRVARAHANLAAAYLDLKGKACGAMVRRAWVGWGARTGPHQPRGGGGLISDFCGGGCWVKVAVSFYLVCLLSVSFSLLPKPHLSFRCQVTRRRRSTTRSWRAASW